MEDIEIDKRKLKGMCITCRRGLFYLFMVWCMHPSLPSGYKAHSPFDTCKGYQMMREFKYLKNMVKIKMNGKYVEPYIKNGEVIRHESALYPERQGGVFEPSGTDKVSTDSKHDNKQGEPKDMEEKPKKH